MTQRLFELRQASGEGIAARLELAPDLNRADLIAVLAQLIRLIVDARGHPHPS